MSQSLTSKLDDVINVLHIDDELYQLEFTKTFIEFSDPNIHIKSVTTPKEAQDRLKNEIFDCIVSDYQMPGMDGIELAEQIRLTSDIPIIMYTGRGSEEVAEAAFTVGVNDYLRKETNPSHYHVLARRIRMAVEKYRGEITLQKQLKEMQVARERRELLEKENLLHFKRLTVLHKHVSEMASVTSLEAVVEKTFDAIGKTLEKHITSFHLVEGEMVNPIYSEDIRLRDLIPLTIEGPGIVARTVREGVSQLVPDTRADPDYITRPGAVDIELLSELTFPVTIDEKVIAVINIESGKRGAFDSNDQRLVEILADHVASAINRIRKIDELKKAIEERELAERELLEYTETLSVAVKEKTLEVLDLERLSAAGKMASMVGHDLRGPLQTIKNALFLMEKDDPGGNKAMRERIRDAVDYAANMLEEVHLNVGESSLNLINSDLGFIIRKVVLEASIPESVEVDLKIADGVDSVFIDRLKIRRVLYNLIKNAVEAMPDGGTLTVSAAVDNGGMEILVRDTGSGIHVDLLPDIFKVFVTSKSTGMGLGLPFCRRAIEDHGGTITVDSEEGVGTLFTVKLPLEPSYMQ